jgi:colicin import membrane protein
MSLMQDPKQIANWLIKRAGSSPAARPYIDTLRNAQGLLLTPGASGVDAVKVVADLKAQGEALRSGTPLESSAKNVGTAAPAAAASGSAAATALAAAKAKADEDKAKADEDKAKADADKAKADEDKAKADADKAKADEDKAKADADKAKADEDKAKADAAAGEGAAETPADADDGANLGAGRRSRKTRHHTPKRKKLSRKKSIKRK